MSWLGRILRNKKKGGSFGGKILRMFGDSITGGAYTAFISPIPTENAGIYAQSGYTMAQTFGFQSNAFKSGLPLLSIGGMDYQYPIDPLDPTENPIPGGLPLTDEGNWWESIGDILGDIGSDILETGVVTDVMLDLIDDVVGDTAPQDIQDAFGIDANGNVIDDAAADNAISDLTPDVTPENVAEIAAQNTASTPSVQSVSNTPKSGFLDTLKRYGSKTLGFAKKYWVWILLPCGVFVLVYVGWKYIFKGKKGFFKKKRSNNSNNSQYGI